MRNADATVNQKHQIISLTLLIGCRICNNKLNVATYVEGLTEFKVLR